MEKSAKTYINCKTCDKRFFYWPCRPKKYCSPECYWKDKKGKPSGYKPTLGMTPWNKGKTYISPKKGKHYASQSGANHWNWKGGISSEDEKARIRFRKLMQEQIFIRDDYTCQICNQRGGKLQVDHIKRWSDYPELRFVESNCRTLCMACHYYVTFKKKIPQGVVWGHNLNRRIAS